MKLSWAVVSIAARWRWWVVGALLLFALNNLVGLAVGALGMLAFANRIAGRALKAGRVIAQVRDMVSDQEDRGDGG